MSGFIPSIVAHNELRAKILRAANKLFREQSYSACSIESIALEVGISKKTLYKVFPSKEAILQSIVDEVTVKISEGLQSILTDANKTFVEKLDTYISFMFEMHQSIAKQEILADIQKHAPAVFHSINEHRKSRVCQIIDFFTSGINEGALRSDINLEIVTMIYLNSITNIMGFGKEHKKDNIIPADIYTIFVHIFYTGLFTQRSREVNTDEKHISLYSDSLQAELKETEQDAILVSRIIDQSRVLFFQFGFNRVTMDEVAAELGISKKTLYKYFDSKEALLEAVFARFLTKANEMQMIIPTSTVDSFVCCFHGFVNHIAGIIGKISPQFVKDMLWKRPELWETIHARRTEMIEGVFAKLLEEGAQLGAVTTEYTAADLAKTYRLVLDSVISPEIISSSTYNPAELYRTVVQVMFYGVLTEPSRSSFDESFHNTIAKHQHVVKKTQKRRGNATLTY
ncbi:MAG: TetR/AcrR family transcriptional regulator [Candidatus Kapabacteria bacterium]|nr:TetR/AcrR family transcriptional regulator [Candidatus Kapabacteria bacterium]